MNSQGLKRSLCYGDSNTWGFIPAIGERYPYNIRWTGVLQSLLGPDFEVIEEGLNSRTTNIEDPNNIGRNGKKYLIPCLDSQFPLDVIILMLGTNDLKVRLNRSMQEIEAGVEELVQTIKNKIGGLDINLF
jgi:lysophospholipase L1-like esterase